MFEIGCVDRASANVRTSPSNERYPSFAVVTVLPNDWASMGKIYSGLEPRACTNGKRYY